LQGQGGDDVLYGGAGYNAFNGGAGNDTFHGEGSSHDTAGYNDSPAGVVVNLATGTASDGWGGTDTLIQIEWVQGSAHDDILIGDSGANRLYGEDGNDTLSGGPGTDILDGGNGIDTVDYSSASSAVTVNLATGTASGDGSDTLSNFENVTGSSHNDTITGSSGDNVLIGGAGNDVIHGGDGNDTIEGGGGADDLYGGSGADVFLFKAVTAFTAPVTIHDFSTSDGDKLDIHDLLTTYDPLTSAITDFVHVTASGGNAVVSVDANGATGGANFVQIATLIGDSALAGTEADLLANGYLIAHAA
jgi:Ca2+-binding RTX toxin-like protein